MSLTRQYYLTENLKTETVSVVAMILLTVDANTLIQSPAFPSSSIFLFLSYDRILINRFYQFYCYESIKHEVIKLMVNLFTYRVYWFTSLNLTIVFELWSLMSFKRHIWWIRISWWHWRSLARSRSGISNCFESRCIVSFWKFFWASLRGKGT